MIIIGLEVLREMEQSEEIQEMESETKKITVPIKRKRKELKQSQIEESQKLKQWEDLFEKWRMPSINRKRNF